MERPASAFIELGATPKGPSLGFAWNGPNNSAKVRVDKDVKLVLNHSDRLSRSVKVPAG